MINTENLGLKVNVADDRFKIHLLAVDDDIGSLEATVEDLEDIAVYDSSFNERYKAERVEIFSTSSTAELEGKIDSILESDPESIIVGFYDERIPGERGTGFSDRIRRKHPKARYAANLVTAFPNDENVRNSRDFGIFAYIIKSNTEIVDEVALVLDECINHVLLRDEPKAMPLGREVIFEQVKTQEDFELCSRLRFDVYSKDRRLPLENDSGYDITADDKYAHHYWGYWVNGKGKKEAIATMRAITHELVPSSLDMVRYVVDKAEHPYLSDHLGIEPNNFPTVEEILNQDIPPEKRGFKDGFVAYASQENCIELSRLIARLDLHGQGLGGMMGMATVAHLLNEGDYRYAIASSAPRLLGMFLDWGAEEHPLGPVNISSVAYISSLWTLYFDKLKEPFAAGVNLMREQLAKQGYAVVTPQTQWLYRGHK